MFTLKHRNIWLPPSACARGQWTEAAQFLHEEVSSYTQIKHDSTHRSRRRGKTPPPKNRENIYGKYHVIQAFFGKYPVKFGKFVNFAGKHHIKFGHFVNFSYIYFRAKMYCPPKVHWAPMPMIVDYVAINYNRPPVFPSWLHKGARHFVQRRGGQPPPHPRKPRQIQLCKQSKTLMKNTRAYLNSAVTGIYSEDMNDNWSM